MSVSSFLTPFADRKHIGHFSSDLRAELAVQGGSDITQPAIIPLSSKADTDIFATACDNRIHISMC